METTPANGNTPKKKTCYVLMGTYQGNQEELDSFETRDEAERMRTEYQIALGASWSISLRKTLRSE